MPSITGSPRDKHFGDDDGEPNVGCSLRQRGTNRTSASSSGTITTEQKQLYASARTSSSAPSLASVSSTSLQHFDDASDADDTKTTTSARSIRRIGSHADRESLTRSVSSILHPKRRFATASSLPWGHKPHPLVGLSCLLFALPVPFLVSCHPITAACFAVVTITSFMSDHVYTGLDSYAHLVDRFVAPLTFLSAMWTVYTEAGIYWTCTCTLALSCHILAHSAAKRNEYNKFVFWHAAWHTVGVALLVACFYLNDTMTGC